MSLDGLNTYLELGCDLLVAKAACDPSKHFFFTTVGICRESQESTIMPESTKFFDHFDAIHFGHANIEHNDMWMILTKP